MSFLLLWLAGFLFCLAQLLAALPWVAVLDLDGFRALLRRPATWGYALLGVAGCGLGLALFLLLVQDRERLEIWGRIYASALHLQLSADLFVLTFALLLRFWPHGGAIALAAFREGVRQPLFWLFVGLGAMLLVILLALPYFTFGEDLKMMKQVDFDLVMLLGAVFGVIAAGVSISEEIEGRTAITLMSKPVSRRQFLLGKFLGVLLATLAMTALLGWVFEWSVYLKPILDPYDQSTDPLRAQFEPALTGAVDAMLPEGEAHAFLRGGAEWSADVLSTLPGLALGFGQVMLFVAIASALATRLPMAVTVVACLLVYFLGHLAPVLLQVSQGWQAQYAQAHGGTASTTYDLVQFVAQLFDTLLPALDYFNLGPAIVRDRPLPPGEYAWYVGAVLLNTLMYTTITLLLGLILFEDRDLA